MKIITKRLFVGIICLVIMPKLFYGMATTFVASSSYFPKPRFARQDLTSFDIYATHDYANSSFDNHGNQTELLSYNGPQDLYNRFVDSTLAYNDTQTMGKALLAGTYTDMNYAVAFTQNIGSHLFISASTSFTQCFIKNFAIRPIKNNCLFLTPDEIAAQTGLTDYLQKLNAILNPSDCGLPIPETIAGPTFIGTGYCTSLRHFSTIDFLDLTFEAGFLIPFVTLDTATNYILSVIPPAAIVNVGIPLLASATIGMYDWLNVGGTVIVMPFIPNDPVIPLNTTLTNNNILINNQGLCSVHHKPFVYLNAYAEAEQLIPHLGLMTGLSYIKQYPTCYHAQDQKMFPDKIINASPTDPQWSSLNITIYVEYDFADHDSKHLPRLTLAYVRTLWGQGVFKTSTFAGIFGLELAYDF